MNHSQWTAELRWGGCLMNPVTQRGASREINSTRCESISFGDDAIELLHSKLVISEVLPQGDKS